MTLWWFTPRAENIATTSFTSGTETTATKQF
jgi:hypothetical protein